MKGQNSFFGGEKDARLFQSSSIGWENVDLAERTT